MIVASSVGEFWNEVKFILFLRFLYSLFKRKNYTIVRTDNNPGNGLQL